MNEAAPVVTLCRASDKPQPRRKADILLSVRRYLSGRSRLAKPCRAIED